MAFITTLPVPPLDPQLFTGPIRMVSGPVRTADVVVDTPYGEFARWIYIGAAGNISYVKWDGTTQVLVAPATGIWHPICSIMVNSAGTTATSLVWGS